MFLHSLQNKHLDGNIFQLYLIYLNKSSAVHNLCNICYVGDLNTPLKHVQFNILFYPITYKTFPDTSSKHCQDYTKQL